MSKSDEHISLPRFGTSYDRKKFYFSGQGNQKTRMFQEKKRQRDTFSRRPSNKVLFNAYILLKYNLDISLVTTLLNAVEYSKILVWFIPLFNVKTHGKKEQYLIDFKEGSKFCQKCVF